MLLQIIFLHLKNSDCVISFSERLYLLHQILQRDHQGCQKKEFAHFLQLSLGSAFEVETQLIIANNLNYIQNHQLELLLQKLYSIEKRLNEMIKRLTH